MAIELSNQKIFVAGTTGSGKTYFVENKLLKAFKHPLVLTPHTEDYTHVKRNVLIHYLNPFTTSNLEEFIKNYVKPLAYTGKIDCLIIDESDLIIPKSIITLQDNKHIYDMFINHRHWGKKKGNGLALVLITRRPQEASTVFLEQAHHLFIFALEGKNVNQHFSKIHKDFNILLPQLNHKKHNFIHKEIGKPPEIHGAVNLNK